MDQIKIKYFRNIVRKIYIIPKDIFREKKKKNIDVNLL